MTQFDLPTLINWLGSGFIGFIFGIAGTWVTYRYERIRDDIAWKREKEKLAEQFNQEKKLMEIEFNQKLLEIEKTSTEQKSKEIRQQLLQGIENPLKTINAMEIAKAKFSQSADNNSNVTQIQSNGNISISHSSYLSWWLLTPKKVRITLQVSLFTCALLALIVVLLATYILKN